MPTKSDSLAERIRYQTLARPETETGRLWRPRLLASEAYHKKHASKWDYLRQLYTNVFTAFKDNMVWSTSLALGWALMNNIVDDTYFQNPESWIEARTNNPDLSRAIRQVTNTIHEDADTEEIMKQAIGSSTWAGFAGHWVWVEQDDGPGGEARAQRVRAEYVSPWNLRFDPAGREWNLRDHKYVVRRFTMSMQAILDEPRFSEQGKKYCFAWAGSNRAQSMWRGSIEPTDGQNTGEQDPRYYDVSLYEIWSLAEGQILWIPEIDGTPAEFELGEAPMPPAFLKAGTYPLTFVAFNREPEDERNECGFYPKPDLELVEGPLETINRLNELYIDAATMTVLKYLYVQGLIGEPEMHKITNDKTRQMIPVDIVGLLKTLVESGLPMSQADPTKVNLRDWVMLLPVEERAAMVKHQEAIEFQLNAIANILGTGPLSRFGLAPARSATESAGLQEAKTQRQEARANAAGRIYDRITEKIWCVLKAQSTLPLIYRSATSAAGDAVWREFNAQEVWNIDLSFRHRVGSNRPRDMAAEKFQRKEVAMVALPILQGRQDHEAIDEIMRWWLEVYDFPSLQVFNSKRREIAKELAKLQFGIQSGAINAADPAVAAKMGDLRSQLIQANLTPQDMAELARELSAAGPGMPAGGADMAPMGAMGGGQGSLPAAESPGERAYAAGSAGAGLSVVKGG